MCFFSFPSPRKKRRSQTAESEQLLPRKRRVSFPVQAHKQQHQHASARSVSAASRSSSRHSSEPIYKPLRGQGVKRSTSDHPIKTETNILRGKGVKRDESESKSKRRSQQPEMTERKRRPAETTRQTSRRSQGEDSESLSRRQSAQTANVSTKTRRAAESANRSVTSKTQRYSVASAAAYLPQQQYSNSAYYQGYTSASAREHPLYTNTTPSYAYSMPSAYYHDLGAVRAATSYALQSQYNQPAYSRNLRRQPGYTRLR